jgi:hypothetical protein
MDKHDKNKQTQTDREMYVSKRVGFLMSEPRHPTCCHLGKTLDISHDCVNRFLLREHYEA